MIKKIFNLYKQFLFIIIDSIKFNLNGQKAYCYRCCHKLKYENRYKEYCDDCDISLINYQKSNFFL